MRCLGLALLHLRFEQLGAQHVPGHGAVAVLRAILLALHLNAGGAMKDLYARRHFVDVLTPLAAGAHKLLIEVVFVNAQGMHLLAESVFFRGGNHIGGKVKGKRQKVKGKR